MKNKKIAIIGAGASGLMSAVLLARLGFNVVLLEKNDKIGKKLLTTGNGRCNITNIGANSEHYFSRSKNISGDILSKYGVGESLKIFESLGISTLQLENGKLYPYSLEAKSVVKAFLYEIEHLNIEILYGTNVKSIKKSDFWTISYELKIPVEEGAGKKSEVKKGSEKSEKKKRQFQYIKRELRCDTVILCTGGMSYASSGSDGSGYELAKSLGHALIKPIPAIVQLVMDENKFPHFKHLSGTKTQARLHLSDGKDVIRIEEGELLFTSYGLSGPPILLLSSNVAQELPKGKSLSIHINFFPEMKYFELKEFLQKKLQKLHHLSIEHLLELFLPNRLISVLLKYTDITGTKLSGEINEKELKRILEFLTDLKLDVIRPYLWEQAQVTSGGISCKEVNPQTLASKKSDGLYFAGEILDIDGDCGGYNLQWAWSSAMCVAEAVKNRME